MIHLHELREFPGYAITKDGKVFSLNYRKKPGKIKELRYTWITGGYVAVRMSRDEKSIQKLIHRLVAEAFIENTDDKPEVNHIDGDKNNNCSENLEWVTPSENMRHAYDSGLKPTTEKQRESWRKINANKTPEQRRRLNMRKLTNDQVREIRRRYFEGDCTTRSLAKEYGIGCGAISLIINHKLYAEV
jgi:hypothetical protein